MGSAIALGFGILEAKSNKKKKEKSKERLKRKGERVLKRK